MNNLITIEQAQLCTTQDELNALIQENASVVIQANSVAIFDQKKADGDVYYHQLWGRVFSRLRIEDMAGMDWVKPQIAFTAYFEGCPGVRWSDFMNFYVSKDTISAYPPKKIPYSKYDMMNQVFAYMDEKGIKCGVPIGESAPVVPASYMHDFLVEFEKDLLS